MATAPQQLAKIRVGPPGGGGQRGSGWAIGTIGVLTARHVIESFLANPYDEGANPDGIRCRAVVFGPGGQAEFSCTVSWQDPARDLAILRIHETQQVSWQQRMTDEGVTVLAAPGVDPISDVQAIGFPQATVENNRPQPEQPQGTLLPAGGLEGEMNFDVDTSTPLASPLWAGMSGAALRETGGERRLLGVVSRRAPDPGARRLYAVALPDPERAAGWAAALREVGADPVVEDIHAPLARRYLSSYDPAGRPWRVGTVPGLREFGPRVARADITPSDQPYFPYVDRPESVQVRAALDAALEDPTAPRIVLLAGESAAGKSRLAAEVVRAHPGLLEHRFISPVRDVRLSELPDLLYRRGRVLLWLDNIHQQLKLDLDPDRARRLLANPRLIIVGTALTAELRALTVGGDGEHLINTGGADLVADEALLCRIDITARPEWAAATEPVVRDAVAAAALANVGLGEYLAAYTQLVRHYRNASTLEKALIDSVSDWARTGMAAPLPEQEAKQLWLDYLPAEEVLRHTSLAADDQAAEFQSARDQARTVALGSTALLERTNRGLRSNEIAEAQRDGEPIQDGMWDHAMTAAGDDPEQAFAVAVRATLAERYSIARTLFTSAAENGRTVAQYNLGVLLAYTIDPPDLIEARLWFTAAAEAGDTEAQYGLGRLLVNDIDPPDLDEARRRWTAAAEAGHTSAQYGLGLLLAYRIDPPDLDEARRWFVAAAEAGNAFAQYDLGVLLATKVDPPDLPNALRCYAAAAEAGHTNAQYNLGAMLLTQVQPPDIPEALRWWRAAAEAGDVGARVSLDELLAALDPPDP